MKAINIAPDPNRILPFYLAAEEWVARSLPRGEYFFAWQVKPTVICGRHQLMQREVVMAYCARKGIAVWRRKSGGGCVYADNNNVMFSYITHSDAVQDCFDRYTDAVAGMLVSLGIDARPGGRNDVEIDGRKVAGNAYYSLPGRSIVHGTMLYDADTDTMSHALTPSRAKLLNRGVKSVPSRITTLRSHGLTMTCSAFVDYAMRYLCRDGSIDIGPEQESEILAIMQTYLSTDFYNDKICAGKNGVSIPSKGEFFVSLTVDADDIIRACLINGDFMTAGDVSTLVTAALAGTHLDCNCVAKAVSDLPSDLFPGLDKHTLTELILNATINKIP